ncbi:M55 family metallopeptidase, partial [uncultured Maritalea sp.]|uniref:M55 family metallopeptidase n=1 Tax=uncultured Maritalea sp. TaxID=757249 RepID=UPI0026061F9C
MKIFISVDIEGVAGVNESLQGARGNPEYEVARRLMSQEANAAIEAAFDAGGTEVTVADSHGPMRNLIVTDLDPRARIVSGKPRPLSMIDDISASYDGAVLIGYHAAADNFGVLSHTISGQAFRRIEINGILTGEPTLFAGHAAEIGVPLLAVSGDDYLANEIDEQFPGTKTIVVKSSIGANATNSLSPVESRKLIKKGVFSAVKEAQTRSTAVPTSPPLKTDVQFHHQMQADAVSLLPFVQRSGPRTVQFECVSYAQAIGCLSAIALIASAVM